MSEKIDQVLAKLTDAEVLGPQPAGAVAPEGPDNLSDTEIANAVAMLHAGATAKEVAVALSIYEVPPADGQPGRRFIRKVPVAWVKELRAGLAAERERRFPTAAEVGEE